MIDALLDEIELARKAGAVVVIKFDGERSVRTHTVIVTDTRTAFFFRRDTDQLSLSLQEALEAFWAARERADAESGNQEGEFRTVFGSDVPNDGCYLELRDSQDRIVACVFRSDATGEFNIDVGPTESSADRVSRFVETAKKELLRRVASN